MRTSQKSALEKFSSLAVEAVLVIVWGAPALACAAVFGRLIYVAALGLNPHSEELVAQMVGWGLLSATVGFIALASDRAYAWAAFACVTILGYVQALQFHSLWGFWKIGTSAFVYTMHAALCALLPLILWAYGRKPEIRILLRRSIALVAVIHVALVVVAMTPGLQHLASLFLSPGKSVMDATGIYSGARRFEGLTSSANATGIILVLTWPALLAPARERWQRGLYLYRLLAMGGAVIATLATFSRAAYLGLLSQVLLLGWYSVTAPRGTTRLASRRALAAIVITILLAVTLYDSVARRMSAATVQSTDASVAHRLEVYRIALQLLLERVGAGWGPSGFASLYSAFYRIPGIAYLFPDVHSAVLCTLTEIGVAGVGLAVLAVLGLPMRRNLSRLPLWVRVAAIGAVIPLTSDHPSQITSSPAIVVVWLACACVIYTRGLRRQSVRREASAGIKTFLPHLLTAALFGWWLISYLSPPSSPADRLRRELARHSRLLTGQQSTILYEPGRGVLWQADAETTYPSGAATIGLLARAAQDSCSLTVDIQDYAPWPGATYRFPILVPIADAVAMLIHELQPGYAQRLIEVLRMERLEPLSHEYFGDAPFRAPFVIPQHCSVCGNPEPERMRPVTRRPGELPLTSATLFANARLLGDILSGETSCTDTLVAAIQAQPDESGALRYLHEVRGCGSLCYYTGTQREELVILPVPFQSSQIILGMSYIAGLGVAPAVDTTANRVFAMAAWRTWCALSEAYGEILPELRAHAKPPAAARKMPWYVPWFLAPTCE